METVTPPPHEPAIKPPREEHIVASSWPAMNGTKNMKIYVTSVFVDDEDKAGKFHTETHGFT